MRILLAAVLATVIATPCMAASENKDEDKSQSDVQTPGVTEPRVPDTLKSAPAERIQSEGRASERARSGEPAAKEKTLGEGERRLNDNEKK
jgi:hypothetical protein